MMGCTRVWFICICCTAFQLFLKKGWSVKLVQCVGRNVQKVKMCETLTWSVEEIFDLEAEQRRRHTCFTVNLCSHRLHPADVVVQGLWESFSWVWTTKDRPKKPLLDMEKKSFLRWRSCSAWLELARKWQVRFLKRHSLFPIIIFKSFKVKFTTFSNMHAFSELRQIQCYLLK